MMGYQVVYSSAIDRQTLTMIDYFIMLQIESKLATMKFFSRQLGRTDFIFTERTRVRLGGFNM